MSLYTLAVSHKNSLHTMKMDFISINESVEAAAALRAEGFDVTEKYNGNKIYRNVDDAITDAKFMFRTAI